MKPSMLVLLLLHSMPLFLILLYTQTAPFVLINFPAKWWQLYSSTAIRWYTYDALAIFMVLSMTIVGSEPLLAITSMAI